MKRNFNENPPRRTAGCLPMPLFNLKRRIRRPIICSPLTMNPGVSTTLDSYDVSPLPTDWAWEAGNPELPALRKTVDTGQIMHSVSHPLRSQDSVSNNSIQSVFEESKSGWSYRDDNKNTSFKTWEGNDFSPQYERIHIVVNDGIKSCPMSLGMQQEKQLRVSQLSNLPLQRGSEVLRQTRPLKIVGSSVRGLDKNSASQAFKPSLKQNQPNKKMLGRVPAESALKGTSLYQLKLKKDNSLRIISAVIESMKYWREHAPKAIVLFEILAVLDSSVTPGPHYSKTFLMRDGKSTLPCVFYEIDRELPRLIRDQVYRCVGNYDQKKNIFKCVSVRLASVSEQKTFQAFVKNADATMRNYTNLMNEI